MKIREFTAKTTEEAIDAGLAELGVTLSDVRVDVLQEGAKGLFGLFGSKPARVRLTVMEDEKEDDQGLSDLLGSFSITEPAPRKKNAPKQERKSAPEGEKSAQTKEENKEKPAQQDKPKKAEKAPKAEKKPAQDKADKPEKPENETKDAQAAESAPEKKSERPAKAKQPRVPKQRAPKAVAADAQDKDDADKEYAPMVPAQPFTPTEPPVIHDEATPAGRAQRFLMDVTALMGVKVDVYVDDSREDHLTIHMIGDTLGILIGRRGETLDALQYLTSLQVNKGRDGYIRVTLDTESYRAKREDSLRRLAQRMANRAQKTGRKVVLEPMNPYERRVLHTALQNSPVVTTHSEGEEPNRRVVITLKNQPERAQDGKSDRTAEGAKPAKRGRNRRRGRRGPKRNASAAPQTADDQGVIVPQTQEPVDILGEEE